MAIFHVVDARLVLVELAPDVRLEDVSACTEAPFDVALPG
jgi:acyl CoA:acetate/3-ketoacid CoA transferase beta subunit